MKIDDSTDAYMARLGHSWSQPVVAQLKWKPNTSLKPVIVFGGGYNEDSDGDEIAGGNAVFIRDALNGSHVWSTQVAEDAGLATDDIENAVPSRRRSTSGSEAGPPSMGAKAGWALEKSAPSSFKLSSSC